MESFTQERICLCALNRIFGFEPRAALGLLHHFGSARAVFDQNREDLVEASGKPSVARLVDRITESAFESAAMELEALERAGCRFVGLGEPGYPELLADCPDPPMGLYFRGKDTPDEVFSNSQTIAVVGTRDPSYYGKDWCQRIVSSLSKCKLKPLIVSGLALGVDAMAHKAALDSGLATLAVMATGIDGIYPARNRSLGERIAETEGCALVSDFIPGTFATKVNFIRRNRIIAGICRATILVESRIKGGGMMTARLASSYERDLFAVPGRLDDPASQGCNLLVREKLAEPVGDLAELSVQLGLGRPPRSSGSGFLEGVREHYQASLTEAEVEDVLRMAGRIKKERGISVDGLSLALKWPFSKASRLATMLECDGFISIDLLQHCCAKS